MQGMSLDRAKVLAEAHGSFPLEVDGYRQTVIFRGRVPRGWLFGYRIVCDLNIPVEEQELFAGAGGCLVTDGGQLFDLAVPDFVGLAHELD
jgi:hypothetical protein